MFFGFSKSNSSRSASTDSEGATPATAGRPSPPPLFFAGTLISDEQLLEHYNKLLQLERVLHQCSKRREAFSLPKIIVVGDQSAGKSSVLEAICKIKLPRDDTTCTRCPIYISMVHNPDATETTYRLSVKWANTTNAEETKAEERPIDGLEAELREEMNRLAQEDGGFTQNAIAIEIRCRDKVLPLTLVDLPGVRVENLSDASRSHKKIHNIVAKFVQDKNCHILHVVDVNHDITTIHSTSELNSMDQDWERRSTTVLTKCDKLGTRERLARFLEWDQRVRGSREDNHASLTIGSDPEVFVIRCPSADERARGQEPNVHAEYNAWRNDVPQLGSPVIDFGVDPLQGRLSQLLITATKAFFVNADVHEDLTRDLHATIDQLKRLGPSLRTERDKQKYWTEHRNRIKKLRKQLLDGLLMVPSQNYSFSEAINLLESQLNRNVQAIALPQEEEMSLRSATTVGAPRLQALVEDITQQLVDQSCSMHVPGLVNAADILQSRVQQMATTAESHVSRFLFNSVAVVQEALFDTIINSPNVLPGQEAFKTELTNQLREAHNKRISKLGERAAEEVGLAKQAYVTAQGELGRAVFEHRRARFTGSSQPPNLERLYTSSDPHDRMRPAAEEIALVLTTYWRLTYQSIVTNVRKVFNREIQHGLLTEDLDGILDQRSHSGVVEPPEIAAKRANLKTRYKLLRQALETVETTAHELGSIVLRQHDVRTCFHCNDPQLHQLLEEP